MATSGMSYAVHYDLSDAILQDFSRMRIETAPEPPVLYVAMATWIPKCNMYNAEPDSPEKNDISQEEPDCNELKTQTVVEAQNNADKKEENDLKETEKVETENNETTAPVTEEKLETENNETIVPVAEEKLETENNETTAPVAEKPIKQMEKKLSITPKKTLSPKQLQKKLESEKKRQQKQLEREEREKKKQEEKERSRLEKEQQKKEKEAIKNKKNEEKAKEREMKEEQKRKEREEKEAKRKEKEEREEAKRKEREQEKLRKQQEIEEKNREKQKIEEQKQKAAQAFVNFFVPKKTDGKVEEAKTTVEEGKTSMFMPFQVKTDMRLAPSRRVELNEEEKENLIENLSKGEASYLKELKEGKKLGKQTKTWPYEEDVVIVEEDVGESICEDKQKKKMRVKFLKFHENKRPPYYGTWRKKSGVINPRRPFSEDKTFFAYDVDSDDDWEEEEQGESLNGSDDEEKENEADNEEYEVDNEFFVPHGHLSDDEVDDEESAKLSPESHKQKLKLLKDEFDLDMKAKTNKMKPRSIGCIWYNKDKSNVDDAIDRHLRPLAMITNGQIIINKRKEFVRITPNRKYSNKELRQELVPAFLKLIQGNVNKKATVVEEFMNYMRTNGHVVEVSKAYLGKCLKQYAQWKKCGEEGPNFNKYCWCLEDDVKKKYNLEKDLNVS